MPMEPNVLNYFLIVLGGFGTVWSFRFFTNRQSKKITEFEYAAFSTLWGIMVFFIFVQALKGRADLMNAVFAVPLTATPSLFVLAVCLGLLGAVIFAGPKVVWHQIKKFFISIYEGWI